MKKPILLIILSGILFPLAGQVPLPLDSAVEKAWDHLQFGDQIRSIEEMKDLDRSIVSNTWFPVLTLNAQSTIQNEQIEFYGGIPGFEPPEIPLDFHRVLLQFNQTLYDGSISTRTKRLKELEGDKQKWEVEAKKLQVRQSVTQVYLNLLLIGDRLGILDLKMETLKAQEKRISGAVEQGALIPSEKAQIKAEILQVEQEMRTVRSTERVMRHQLASLMGYEDLDGFELIHPGIQDNSVPASDLPEVKLIDQQVALLQAQQKLTGAQNLPQLNLFGNVGAGNPGYNLFAPGFSPMLYAGVRLTWQPIHWNKVKDQKEKLALQASILQMEKERVAIRLENERLSKWEEFKQKKELTETDLSIVELRKEVSQSKSSQLENGVITTSEYLVELNKEHLARLNASLHELEAAMAYIEYLILSGK